MGGLDAVANFGGFAKAAVAVPGIAAPLPPAAPQPGAAPKPPSSEEVVVRKAFPESWLWSNVTAA